jgi:hypothetical protein
MTTTISINELLPTGEKIRKIQTGSELIFAFELSKYTRTMLGKELSLSDVSIAKELLAGEHFSFVVMNGLDVGIATSRENLADYQKSERYFFKGTVEGVAFSSVTPEEVVFNYQHDVKANIKIHGDDRSAAYVSLMAYLIVKAKAEGVAIPKLVIDHETYNQQELEYVDLIILKTYGNKVLKNVLDVKFSTAWGFQPDWEAFVIYNRQRGLMNAEYSVTEKYKYLKKNFEVGDVVLFYTRSKGAKGKTINQLKACYPAVVRYIDANTVKLSYFPIVQTLLTRHMELIKVEEDFFEEEGKESIYTQEDYDRFITCDATYNLTEIGVDSCTFIEQTFFIKPVDFDGSYQHIRSEDSLDTLFLSTLNTIYAVFEDRGVEYNKEKFLKTHFHSKNQTPIYDQYVSKVQ